MRVTAEYPLPVGAYMVFPRDDGRFSPQPPAVEKQTAAVTDPVLGRIGDVVAARTTSRAGRDFLVLTLEIDDGAAVSASTRSGGSF